MTLENLEIAGHKPDEHILLNNSEKTVELIKFFGKRYVMGEAPKDSASVIFYPQQVNGECLIILSFFNNQSTILRQLTFIGNPKDLESPQPKDFRPTNRIDWMWVPKDYTNPVTKEYIGPQTMGISKLWEYQGKTGKKIKKEIVALIGTLNTDPIIGNEFEEIKEIRQYKPIARKVIIQMATESKLIIEQEIDDKHIKNRPNFFEIKRIVYVGNTEIVYETDYDIKTKTQENKPVSYAVLKDTTLKKVHPQDSTEVSYITQAGLSVVNQIPSDLGPATYLRF